MGDNVKYHSSSARFSRWRAGMTLIEVLVAMIILGTLLASAVTARGRYITQATRALQKQHAVAAADALLIRWSSDWRILSSDSSGPVPDEPLLMWKRRILDRPDARDLGVRVLRLEIVDIRSASQSGAPAALPPLASIEVLIPSEQDTASLGVPKRKEP